MIDKLLNDIKDKVEIFDNEIKNHKSQIAKLTQKGTSSAKIYIRKDKSGKSGETIETYYFIFPQKNGKRRKEYIGRDEDNIFEAKKKIERYKIRSGLIEELEYNEGKKDQLLCKLKSIL